MENYIRAKRFGRLINFSHVFLGMALVRGWGFHISDMFDFLKIVIIFGVFLYGSLYAINNIADRNVDKKSKLKARRVVADGQISYRWLRWDATIGIVLAFILTWVLYPRLIGIAGIFLGLNLLYTFFFKRIDQMVASIIMSLSHPLRVAMGVAMLGENLWKFLPWYLLVWMGLIAILTRKIQNERKRYFVTTIRLIRWFSLGMFIVLFVALTMKHDHLIVLAIYGVYYLGFHVVFHFSPAWRQRIFAAWRY